MRIRKSHLLLLLMLTLSSIVLFDLYIRVPAIKADIITNMREDSLRSISIMIKNFERHLNRALDDTGEPVLTSLFINDPKLRESFESELNMLISNEVKYAFMLYRDDKGKYRFLLDGSTEEKVKMGRKFDISSDAWNSVYDTKKARLIEQQDLTELWLTYILPITRNGHVEGVVAVDLSFDHHQNHISIIQPLQQMLMIVLGLILVIVLVTLAQYGLYYFTHKKVYIDALTGIKNRQFLNDILPTMNFHKYHIAMIDIDRFKGINDAFGHDTGDLVLQTVAMTLNEEVRDEDLLVRYGGEEFILFLLARNTSETEVVKILERLRIKVQKLIIRSKNDAPIKPTISLGANISVNEFKNVHDAIKIADQKLYEAKIQGRNRLVSYTSHEVSGTSDGITLNIHQVKEAIEEQRLFFEYQPIMELSSGKAVKYEVLARIRHTDGTTLYPISFLPHIQKSQVYKELTLQLLQQNFSAILEHRISMAFNLNITDILDSDIFEYLLLQFKIHPDLSSFVTFELLEEEQISDVDTLIERISTLHTLGAHFAIDDFGTGYSNFSHLLQLDIDIIKIDGSLIRHIDQSDLSLQLVEAIVAFAKTSKKIVIAEFIHSDTVMKMVQEIGITAGQGYYLGKPGKLPKNGLS